MSESDEFDAYDLSEFTEDDFAAIDAHLARAHTGPVVQIALEHSPLQRFLSWKKHLAVTDLVSPLWCEVQYEYSLYGQRHKPLHLRPPAFRSKSGKQIRVHQPVACANDQTLRRGKSVHKALEDELTPEKVIVHAVSEEERFGLRLLQLIDGFNQLVSNGIARELPVFAITHAQVVLGVIDEVLRLPLPRPDQDQAIPLSPPATPPGSPPSKKQRWSSSQTQQIMPSAPELPSSMDTDRGAEPNSEGPYELRIVDYKTRRSSNVPLDEDSLSPRLQLMMYHRMLSSVLEPEALDFDLLWTRLNLDPAKPFSPQFLKDILWDQRRADPADRNLHLNRLVSEWSSTVQRNRAGLMGVSQQLQIVYRRSVYVGKRGKREKGKARATETVDVDNPLAALALQEELDLARAIEQSLSEIGYQGANQVADLAAHNVKQLGPSSVGRTSAIWKDLVSPLDSGQTDPILAWAIQESLFDCVHKAHAQASANKLQQVDATHDDPLFDETTGKPAVIASRQQVQEGAILDISPIIGTKEFNMNDEELDAHIADVLQWWLGVRPPRGVDVSQTNRCFTCEYRESCEWREQKAKEAVVFASGESCNDIWPTTAL